MYTCTQNRDGYYSKTGVIRDEYFQVEVMGGEVMKCFMKILFPLMENQRGENWDQVRELGGGGGLGQVWTLYVHFVTFFLFTANPSVYVCRINLFSVMFSCSKLTG